MPNLPHEFRPIPGQSPPPTLAPTAPADEPARPPAAPAPRPAEPRYRTYRDKKPKLRLIDSLSVFGYEPKHCDVVRQMLSGGKG